MFFWKGCWFSSAGKTGATRHEILDARSPTGWATPFMVPKPAIPSWLWSWKRGWRPTWSPRPPPRGPPPRSELPLPRPAAQAPAPPHAMSAAGAGWTMVGRTPPATHTALDHTPTRGEAGSLTSPAADTAAVDSADAAAPATTTRASQLCAISVQFSQSSSYFFFFFFV
jgi:hypothetical protein